ncbi:hypothetical protein BDW66DRAFT_140881 [Aspergillus desertorum]
MRSMRRMPFLACTGTGYSSINAQYLNNKPGSFNLLNAYDCCHTPESRSCHCGDHLWAACVLIKLDYVGDSYLCLLKRQPCIHRYTRQAS